MTNIVSYLASASFLFGMFSPAGLPVAPLALPPADTGYFLKAPVPVQFVAKVTGYNAVVAQTNSDPMTTASGLRSNPEIVAAKSRDLDLPFGTVIRLSSEGRVANGRCGIEVVEEFIGYRVIADVMHARKRNQIDIMLDHTSPVPLNGRLLNPGVVLGYCEGVTVEVVGMIPLSKLPDTQEALVAMIEG